MGRTPTEQLRGNVPIGLDSVLFPLASHCAKDQDKLVARIVDEASFRVERLAISSCGVIGGNWPVTKAH